MPGCAGLHPRRFPLSCGGHNPSSRRPGNSVTDDTNKPFALIMTALNWSYDHASAAIPGIGSAEGLAKSRLASCGGDAEQAIDHLIKWQTRYAFSAGFVSNLGGIVTMPIGIPANLASVLLIQLRMIAAVAHLRGYEIADERVKTLAFISLTGSASAALLEEFSVNLGIRLGTQALRALPGAILVRINHAVGFQLVTKVGTTGLVNLTKIVPIIGGVFGGGFDAGVTKVIGRTAKSIFKPVQDHSFDADTAVRVPDARHRGGPLIEGKVANAPDTEITPG
jgi:hypothetical protein